MFQFFQLSLIIDLINKTRPHIFNMCMFSLFLMAPNIKLTLVMLNLDLSSFKNTVDLDQLASDEEAI